MGLAISPETVWEGAPRKGSNKNAAVARPRHRNNRLCILLTMAERWMFRKRYTANGFYADSE